MDNDDIIYLTLLIFSICFGYFYRRIPTADLKKKIGALVGVVVVVLVSGLHTLHILVTVLVNSFIILLVEKRQCHVASFAFSFAYLIFFRSTTYFGIPYPPGHTNLIQMILTLKIVGLAFEVNSSFKLKQNKDVKNVEETLEIQSNTIENLQFQDIFYYSFNYCGILTGPYFRYRTFVDHLHKPYYLYDDYQSAVIKKLMYVPIFAVFYLWGNHTWPLSYVMTGEFEKRSFLYRYWYIWPTFFVFRMRIYIGLILSECVCVMAGLGVYPAFTEPKAGHGPTRAFQKSRELTNPDELKSIEYNYETTHNINPYGADFCPTMREGMKHWNICIQYWLAVYVYKCFPNKKYRTLVTMLVSALWHGVYTGYYVCISTVPFGLIVEDVWVKLLLKDNEGLWLKVSEFVMLFLKMQLFSYQAISFGLLEVRKILKYYNSVYHCLLWFYLALYFVGRYLLQIKRAKQKNKQANVKKEEEFDVVKEVGVKSD